VDRAGQVQDVDGDDPLAQVDVVLPHRQGVVLESMLRTVSCQIVCDRWEVSLQEGWKHTGRGIQP
jgi:hypothetical protein